MHKIYDSLPQSTFWTTYVHYPIYTKKWRKRYNFIKREREREREKRDRKKREKKRERDIERDREKKRDKLRK